MTADNPRARRHHEETADRRSSWACIPLRDAVEVREELRRAAEAIEPLLALVRAALLVESATHDDQRSGAYCACVLHDDFRRALTALPESVRVAARKPE